MLRVIVSFGHIHRVRTDLVRHIPFFHLSLTNHFEVMGFQVTKFEALPFRSVFLAFPIITKYGQILQPKNDIAVITLVSTVLNFNELVISLFPFKKNCQVNEESSHTRRSPCYKPYSSHGLLSWYTILNINDKVKLQTYWVCKVTNIFSYLLVTSTISGTNGLIWHTAIEPQKCSKIKSCNMHYLVSYIPL